MIKQITHTQDPVIREKAEIASLQHRVPKLRFNEFEGEWKQNVLVDLATRISDGIHSTPQYDDNGEYFFVNGNNLKNSRIEIFENTKRVSFEEYNKHKRKLNDNTILISINGTIGNLAFYNGEKILLGKSACYINLNLEINKNLIYNQLQTSKIQNYFISELTGSTIKNLSLKTIKETKLFLPTNKTEQQKIAGFLSAVDTKVQQLTQKKELLEQYKKGVMQLLFSQKLRFKKEDGSVYPDWEEKKLGKIAERISTKNTQNEVNFVLTNSATQGVVSQQDYFDKEIANQNNLEGYYIVSKDDFVYNPRISSNAPVGPIKRNKLETGVMSPLYSIFRFKEPLLEYFEHYFETTYWHKYLQSVANFGARHDRMNITNSDFFKMPIPMPCFEERKKIADYLGVIDTKIEQVAKTLEATQQFKKGLLQQLFV